jgi:hypothetical protein
MNKSLANRIHKEAADAVKAIAEKYGMEAEKISGSYGEADMKIHIRLVGTDPSGKSPAVLDFERLAGMYGAKQEWLGQTFTEHGQTFTLTGLKPRNRKYPFLAEAKDGGQYKFTRRAINTAFAGDPEPVLRDHGVTLK